MADQLPTSPETESLDPSAERRALQSDERSHPLKGSPRRNPAALGTAGPRIRSKREGTLIHRDNTTAMPAFLALTVSSALGASAGTSTEATSMESVPAQEER